MTLGKTFYKTWNHWNLKSISFIIFTGLVMGASVASAAPAAPKVGPGCDPAFMAAIQKKAWMEAKREITIAQATIAKPDSVFTLGCFGAFTNGYNISFTNNNIYPFQQRINTFVGAAFAHKLGGGHYPASGNNNGANRNCAVMSVLWNAARCDNLTYPSKVLDTLQDISKYDRGPYPVACPAPQGAWGAIDSVGTPLGDIYGAKVAGKSVNAPFDDMSLFLGVTAPLSQLGSLEPPIPEKCSKGVPTGISIGNNPEIICPNPGCVSDGTDKPKCCDSRGEKCSEAYNPPAPPPG